MNQKSSQRFKKPLHILAFLTVVVTVLIFMLISPPKKTEALQIFTPFGGQVEEYDLGACVDEVTAPIATATLGTVWVTIESIKIGKPSETTIGMLRIDGVTIPGLTKIYRNYAYFVPEVWVLGNSFNLCDICEKAEDIPGVKKICELFDQKENSDDEETIFDKVCGLADDSSCPITNLVHKIGTSLPTAEDDIVGSPAEATCQIIGAFPIPDVLIEELCP